MLHKYDNHKDGTALYHTQTNHFLPFSISLSPPLLPTYFTYSLENYISFKFNLMPNNKTQTLNALLTASSFQFKFFSVPFNARATSKLLSLSVFMHKLFVKRMLSNSKRQMRAECARITGKE